jgi:hypothetical protein
MGKFDFVSTFAIPVPPMEQILQQVSGSERLSLLYGFSGYNQVLMSPSDQLKTTFRTPWGTYAYRKMPFGLINVGPPSRGK